MPLVGPVHAFCAAVLTALKNETLHLRKMVLGDMETAQGDLVEVLKRKIIWHAGSTNEFASPFQRGRRERKLRPSRAVPEYETEELPFEKRERHLRITFHTSSLTCADGTESAPLEALYELCRLPEVEALETGVGNSPQIQVGGWVGGFTGTPVTVKYENGQRFGSIDHPNVWSQMATYALGVKDEKSPAVVELASEIELCAAHTAVDQDILVTLSPNLHRFWSVPVVRAANPRSPSDAAKIVGLFLRSRDNFTYRFTNCRYSLPSSAFYSSVVFKKVQELWKYGSACLNSSRYRQADQPPISELAAATIERCTRAVMARDAIAEQFYMPSSNSTINRMMYHFDYLTLLLGGAIDSLGLVAHRAYAIKQPKENDAQFDRSGFKKALQIPGAKALHELIECQRSKDVMTLINQPRNTVHSACFPALPTKVDNCNVELTLAKVGKDRGHRMLEAAERLGSASRWGLLRFPESQLLPANETASKGPLIYMEPYAYSIALVEDSLRLINEILEVIDLTRLFPVGVPVPELETTPRVNGNWRHIYSEDTQSRLALLC